MTEVMGVKLDNILYKPISGSSLGLFRILSGLLLTGFFLVRFANKAYIDATFVNAQILFKYPGLEFIEMGPAWLIYSLCYSLSIASFLLAIGLFYRIVSIYLLLAYGYLFFLDMTLGNNHFYLFILLFFFFSITNCNRNYSLDAKIHNFKPEVLSWNLYLFRFQFFIAYFMGGVAKINADWLTLKTAKAMIAVRLWEMSEATSALFAAFFAYGGLIFDLTAPVMLLFEKSRKIAFPFIILFNVVNLFMHQIDIFPLIMIGSYILFIPPEKTESYLIKKSNKIDPRKTNSDRSTTTFKKRIIGIFLAFFISFQILFPLRHLFIPGNILWTGDGYSFSWHMMTSFSGGIVKFKVRDKITNKVFWISPEEHLNPRQHKFLFRYPHLSVQFAKLLEKIAIQDGLYDPEVTVILKVGLNGRDLQYMINPNLDLTRVNISIFGNNPWVLPLDDEK